MFHPPPRCKDHPLQFQAGCAECRNYTRQLANRRYRLTAYGVWQPFVAASTVRDHLQYLTEAGMSLRQIAARAGVSNTNLSRVNRGVTLEVTAEVASCVLGVAPAGQPHVVDSIGVARRLQALAYAGYGAGYILLHHYGGVDRTHFMDWRNQSSPRVLAATHGRIATIYGELWDTSGPSNIATRSAVQRGWHPFDAWTDATIDDPGAQPYTAQDAVRYIDWEKLNRTKLPAGHRLRVNFVDLTPAEQRHLYDLHVQAGGSPRGFRDRYRPVPIAILRALAEAEL